MPILFLKYRNERFSDGCARKKFKNIESVRSLNLAVSTVLNDCYGPYNTSTGMSWTGEKSYGQTNAELSLEPVKPDHLCFGYGGTTFLIQMHKKSDLEEFE